ncbi:phosphopantetheine-binding protein [Vibrio sp. PP-XX7]
MTAPSAVGRMKHHKAEAETVLAGLWGQLLGIESVSRHDHFELGGHSLLAVQMVERLRQQALCHDGQGIV